MLSDIITCRIIRAEKPVRLVRARENLKISGYGSQIKIFPQSIPLSVRAAEISAEGISIFKHDPKGKVADAYWQMTQEVLLDEE